MKPSKQIPTRLKINVLIIIVGLGFFAFGIVTTTTRILGTPVQEYARLVPFYQDRPDSARVTGALHHCKTA